MADVRARRLDTPASVFLRFFAARPKGLEGASSGARQVLPSIPLRAPQSIEAESDERGWARSMTSFALQVPAIECSLTCYSACHQAPSFSPLPMP